MQWRRKLGVLSGRLELVRRCKLWGTDELCVDANAIAERLALTLTLALALSLALTLALALALVFGLAEHEP